VAVGESLLEVEESLLESLVQMESMEDLSTEAESLLFAV
jgi:hypothetical protein